MALITESAARPRPVSPLQPKGGATGALVAWEPLGAPVWTPRDYPGLRTRGASCRTRSCLPLGAHDRGGSHSTIPLLLYEREAEVSEHPLLELLRRPSADHTQTDFLEAWYGFLLVAGNAYAEAVEIGGRLRELHVTRPHEGDPRRRRLAGERTEVHGRRAFGALRRRGGGGVRDPARAAVPPRQRPLRHEPDRGRGGRRSIPTQHGRALEQGAARRLGC